MEGATNLNLHGFCGTGRNLSRMLRCGWSLDHFGRFIKIWVLEWGRGIKSERMRVESL